MSLILPHLLYIFTVVHALNVVFIFARIWAFYVNTVCPRSSDPFYILTFYIKLVTTSWTDGTMDFNGKFYVTKNVCKHFLPSTSLCVCLLSVFWFFFWSMQLFVCWLICLYVSFLCFSVYGQFVLFFNKGRQMRF